MASMISYPRPDGQSVSAYLAEPEGGSGPGVVVLQEWWGLNDQIRGVADRLALAGYVALVPDLYRGKSTVEAEEAHHLMSNLKFGEAAAQDVRGAVAYLKTRCPKVGVTGFCMGGVLTVMAMTAVPEADAGVSWYGFPALEQLDASLIRAPLMGHWATQDGAFAIANVDVLEEKFRTAKLDYTGHRYLAYHAFANETAAGPRRVPFTQYDPVWAQIAWDRTLRFFGRHLG